MNGYIVLILIIVTVFGCVSLFLLERIKKEKKRIKSVEEEMKKNVFLFRTTVEWVRLLQEKKSIAVYLEKHNYKSVAIYGMGILGVRLIEECKDTGVEVKYGIDKNAGRIYSDVPVIYPDETLELVDAIIVTAMTYYEEVKAMLRQRTDSVILSLEDILDDM